MFGISDLIGVVVVENRLRHLVANPDQLNFILKPFCTFHDIREKVGARYISQAVEFVIQNQVHVAPYYQADLQKIPSIVFVSRTGEKQQYIGDTANDECAATYAPFVYDTFDVKGIQGLSRDELVVPAALNIEDKIWKGVTLANGDFTTRVDGINVSPGKDTIIAITGSVPEGTNFTGWKAQSTARTHNYSVRASTEAVELVCKLTTSGDYAIHRLMSIVTRYCLKSGRMLFEHYGLQVPTISQGMPVLMDQDQMVYETTFTINGSLTERWVDHEYVPLDQAGDLEADFSATNGENCVKL